MAHGDSTRATTRTVRVGDADIHVTEWGAGPPVLLLHGNPDSGIMWEGVADRMAAEYRCIAPDLLGFGIRKCRRIFSARSQACRNSSRNSSPPPISRGRSIS